MVYGNIGESVIEYCNSSTLTISTTLRNGKMAPPLEYPKTKKLSASGEVPLIP